MIGDFGQRDMGAGAWEKYISQVRADAWRGAFATCSLPVSGF
jgi:hypothetical protein